MGARPAHRFKLHPSDTSSARRARGSRSRLWLTGLMAGFFAVSALAEDAPVPIFPLEEVRPGMMAVARTVFAGEEIVEFSLEILGIHENMVGPGQDVIVARLVGEQVEHTGVVAGMSGSPVYVGERLVGALSYRFGSFAKDPLAGITPIENMLPLLEMESTAAAASVHVDPRSWTVPLLPALPGVAVDLAPEGEAWNESDRPVVNGSGSLWEIVASQHSPRGAAAGPASAVTSAPRGGAALRPIETPIVFGGLDPSVLSAYSGRLRRLGLLAVQGGTAGGAGSAGSEPPPFEAGSPISAQLARGDVDISASGTVTYVSDGKVLAFGHPFLRRGTTEIPFAAGRVIVTVASLENSFKMTVPWGESLGVLRQDRLTAVAGQIGEEAELIPVELSVDSAGMPPRHLSFEIFRDPTWAPLILEIALAGSMVNALDFSRPSTVSMEAVLKFEGYPEFRLNNLFSGMGAPLTVQQTAAGYLTSIFAVLYANRFETPRVRGLEVAIRQVPSFNFTAIEDLWLSSSRVAPGEEVTLRVFLRPYRGERTHHDFVLRVPASLPEGKISIIAGGGQSLWMYEQALLRTRLTQSETLEQMMQVLENLPRFDRLYVRLVRKSAGGVLKDRLAPALPLSVMRVLRSAEVRGDFTPVREETLSEDYITLDGTVYGGRRLTLRVKKN